MEIGAGGNNQIMEYAQQETNIIRMRDGYVRDVRGVERCGVSLGIY